MRKTVICFTAFVFAAFGSWAVYDAYNRSFATPPSLVMAFPEFTVSKLELSRVDSIRNMFRNPTDRRKLKDWNHSVTNGVEHYTRVLHRDGINYRLIVFPDSLRFSTDAGSEKGSVYVVFDHDFDGLVEAGWTEDTNGAHRNSFDLDMAEGLQYRGFYQEIYRRGLIKIDDSFGS